MKLTTIFLVRHGDVKNPGGKFYGRSVNVPLSTRGEKQTKELGKYLQRLGHKPVAIYASPMLRARQTAQEISKTFKQVHVRTDMRLNETDSSGLEGYTIEFLTNLSDIYHSNLTGVSIEPADKLVKRVRLFIDQMSKEHLGQSVVAVSHGDPIGYTLWSFLKSDPLPSWSILRETLYLKRGEAAKLVFGDHGTLFEHSFFRLASGLELKEKK